MVDTLNMDATLKEILKNRAIEIHEPFAEYLEASQDEVNFSIRLIDVVRLAGHTCRAVSSAYLLVEYAKKNLFPSQPLIRGQLRVRISGEGPHGSLGPISQVISYITGAWGATGFPGFEGGRFSRRNLLTYDPQLPASYYEFERIDTGQKLRLRIKHENVPAALEGERFQSVWRKQVLYLLENSDQVVEVL